MSECPAGVRRGEWRDLAMLVTDVEGSTHLARSYGERWGVTLAQYHEVLIRTVHEHSGHVEHIEGDGALVLFADARSGLAAAVALQLALTAEGWSGPPLNTRMGLHFGPVSRPGVVLVGLEIHRAARVGSAANGGQVIVTERVQRDLVDCACLEDLGEFRLKDFPEAQRLFHVVIAGRTAADFPALRTAPVQPNNLPPEIGGCTGETLRLRRSWTPYVVSGW
jgi:class 3 adenylate cyclase